MNGKIMDNRVIKSLVFLVLAFLFISSGQGAFSVQRDEESKVIFIVR
jgi:hypothetical protein